MAQAFYRVYFNRRGAPSAQAWSIDTGEGTERRHFRSVTIKVTALSFYNGKDPDWQNPIAWFGVRGRLNVSNGHASITVGRKTGNDSNASATVRRRVRARAGQLRA